MNYRGNGETRFLLKQFQISLPILNQYTDNLTFELVYRLFPFRDQLHKLLYNLLEQCLNHCPLLLITDEQRQQCLLKYSLSNIIYSNISPFQLILVTDDWKFDRFYNYYTTTVKQFDIIYERKGRDDKLISSLYNNEYLCCLTSNAEIISMNISRKEEVMMAIPCNQLISLIQKEMTLIISSSYHVLQIWNCSKNILSSEYDFNDDIIEDYFIKNSILKVNLKLSRTSSYFLIDDNCQFKLTQTMNRYVNNHQHCILLDTHVKFYYSFHNSKTSLIIYDENNLTEIYNDIDFLFLPKSVIHLTNSNLIAWLLHTHL